MVSMDGLGVFFKENGKKAVDVAKDAATVAKLRADIKSEELKMNNTYVEIGKLFCSHASGEIDEVFIPLLHRVEDSKKTILELEAELDKLRKTVTCPECGAKSPAGSSFCNACGAELNVSNVTNEKAEKEAEGAVDAEEVKAEVKEEAAEKTDGVTETTEEATETAKTESTASEEE